MKTLEEVVTETVKSEQERSQQFTAQDFVLNCSTLLTELPVNDRAAAAAAEGFTQVEFWWPFDGNPVPGEHEVQAFIDSLNNAGVSLVGLNFWAGHMAGGDRGRVSTKGECSAFKENVEVVVEIGKRTGCKAFNALYGLRQSDFTAEEQDALAIKNLVHAANAVSELDGTVLLEPVSGAEDYPLKTAADALRIIDEVKNGDSEVGNAQNIALLADFYHLAVNGDDVAQVIEHHAADFGHIQIADNPGRGAPGTGSLPLFAWLDRARELGYTGHVALEYKQDHASAFDWLKN